MSVSGEVGGAVRGKKLKESGEDWKSPQGRGEGSAVPSPLTSERLRRPCGTTGK